MLGMYVMYVCYVCMLCMYVMYVPLTPVNYNYIYIGLGQIHPALLLMRQWCQSFNHLFRVTQSFGIFFFTYIHNSNKNWQGVEGGQDPILRESQEN